MPRKSLIAIILALGAGSNEVLASESCENGANRHKAEITSLMAFGTFVAEKDICIAGGCRAGTPSYSPQFQGDDALLKQELPSIMNGIGKDYGKDGQIFSSLSKIDQCSRRTEKRYKDENTQGEAVVVVDRECLDKNLSEAAKALEMSENHCIALSRLSHLNRSPQMPANQVKVSDATELKPDVTARAMPAVESKFVPLTQEQIEVIEQAPPLILGPEGGLTRAQLEAYDPSAHAPK